MKRSFIIFIGFMAIIVPAVIIPLIELSFEFVSRLLPILSVNVAIDSSHTMTSVEYITLYLSLLGVIATIILAYLIYRLERNNEKRAEHNEIKRVKRTLHVLLHNGLNRAIKCQNDDEWITYDFIRVTDNHIGMIASIGHLLSDEQFLKLNQIMETLKDIADYEKGGYPGDARKSVDRLIRLITIPIYPMYYFYLQNLISIYDILSEKTISIFNLLADDNNRRRFTYGITYNSKGKMIFECYKKNHFIVYDESENIICDATFDENGIIDGNAKTFYEKGLLEYKGLFRDGKRCGWGIEYLYNENKGKEGEWKNNQLINGIVYDVIVDKQGGLFMDTVKQIELPSDLYDIKRNATDLRVGNVKVINGQMEVIKESIMKVTDLIANENEIPTLN